MQTDCHIVSHLMVKYGNNNNGNVAREARISDAHRVYSPSQRGLDRRFGTNIRSRLRPDRIANEAPRDFAESDGVSRPTASDYKTAASFFNNNSHVCLARTIIYYVGKRSMVLRFLYRLYDFTCKIFETSIYSFNHSSFLFILLACRRLR